MAKKITRVFLFAAFVYLTLSYFILPQFWEHYEHHPHMAEAPKISTTREGLPGDPINIGLVGGLEEVVAAMNKAGWFGADPVTLKSSVGMIESVLVGKAYPDAPMSNLYLWGRRQDLAFEKSVGLNEKKRHHVRFWRSEEYGRERRPLWLGAVTFDRSVGISHRTGQITHHIAPDIDGERDFLVQEIRATGQLQEIYQVTGVGLTLQGRNGGGDWYYTDGEMTIGVLAPPHEKQPVVPKFLENPPRVEWKNEMVKLFRSILRSRMGKGAES